MPTFISPKVNIQEIDISTTIPSVATSIAVIALRNTWKGPEMTQKYVTSENELVDMFGEPIKRIYDHNGDSTVTMTNYHDMFSAIGYLKYGKNLYCTRVMSPSATFAGTTLDSGGT